MYIYDKHDHTLVGERVQQFRRQTSRYLAGELSEDEFLPLRLQNGVYIQRLAAMLRVAVPYGMLSSRQLRKLAQLCRTYDKGYCHITTRQNLQFNWPKIEDIPDLLAELASVEMHAIQTSGNCIRNITSDQFAGMAKDEIVDPRPYCEMVRQWSTLHPEFAFLPRKFKIAISGSQSDRAATHFHDIGLQIVVGDEAGRDFRGEEGLRGEVGFRVLVGGGLGRTPLIAPVVREFLPQKYLLSYLCAILRVYNRLGRRDNKYKARIKILVRAMGVEAFSEAVDQEWQCIKNDYSLLSESDIEYAQSFFSAPLYEKIDAEDAEAQWNELAGQNRAFGHWLRRNVSPHRVAGYKAVTLSLKPCGVAPGDITDRQLEAVADLAEAYSFGEVRTTHQQNIVLSDVKIADLFEFWKKAKENGFANPNIGSLTDIICCPGGDYCSLANARSLPVADAIQSTFDDLDYVYDLGDISLNISGCMNACAHHHIGNIGILGVDKKGQEFFQVTLGGSDGSGAVGSSSVYGSKGEVGNSRATEGRAEPRKASIGKVLGPAFSADEIPGVIEKILAVFVGNRNAEELFVDTYTRLGMGFFKERVYAKAD